MARRIQLTGLALFAVSLAGFAVMVLSQWKFDTTLIDLVVYRGGGQTILSGQSLYDAVFTHVRLEFTYTPFAAMCFIAVAKMPLPVAEAIWSMITVGALAGSVWIALKMLAAHVDRRTRIGVAAAIAAAALWLEPVLWHLLLGQIDIVLMCLILADLARTGRAKGLGVGIAAGIKITPGVFILYLLAIRQYRAAAYAAGAFAATVLMGFTLRPYDSQRYWFGALLDTGRVGPAASPSNQSLNGLLQRGLGNEATAHFIWFNLAFVVLYLVIRLAVRAHSQGHELMAVTVCALGAVLVAPVSWTHHWVWIIPALMVAGSAAINRPVRAKLAIAAMVAAFAAWPTFLWPSLPEDWHWELITTGSWGLNGATELLAITTHVHDGVTHLLESAYPAAALALMWAAFKFLQNPSSGTWKGFKTQRQGSLADHYAEANR